MLETCACRHLGSVGKGIVGAEAVVVWGVVGGEGWNVVVGIGFERCGWWCKVEKQLGEIGILESQSSIYQAEA